MENKEASIPVKAMPFIKFKALLKLAWEICNNNDDFILFINGPRGTGKSLAGITLLREYLDKYFHIDFNQKVMKEHVIYQYDQLFNRAKHLPDKHPILVDEGVRVAFTGDFATKEVKELVKFFTQCRTKNRLVIFISPEFSDISKRLRNYAKYRVRMIERRKGILFCRDDSEGVDPFHLAELKDIEKFHDISIDTEAVINRIQRHLCYKDFILFHVVPKYIQDLYGEYRDEAVYGESPEATMLGKNDRSFMIVFNFQKNWNKILNEVRDNKFRLANELTASYVWRNLCFDPVDGTPFWKNEKALRDGLSLIKKRLIKPKLEDFKKDVKLFLEENKEENKSELEAS